MSRPCSLPIPGRRPRRPFRRICGYVSAFLTLAIAGCVATGSERFPSTVSNERWQAELVASLVLPEGPGPHPAIVMLHGCSGLQPSVSRSLQDHAQVFRQHGYASLIVDSFGPRGKSEAVCRSEDELARARLYRVFDAFDAKRHLQARPDIDPDRIYLLGQSNGGSVAIAASQAGRIPDDQQPFTATVAFYPYCRTLTWGREVSPVLVLTGALDDWTPPQICQFAAEQDTSGMLRTIVYPGAHHSFDLDIDLQTYAGHTVGGNWSATSRARQEILSFLETHRSPAR